jgi:hypothetical protein
MGSRIPYIELNHIPGVIRATSKGIIRCMLGIFPINRRQDARRIETLSTPTIAYGIAAEHIA